ncbi:MAG: ArgR family transcriptional regulator [Elusimicrobiota bacterium]
MDKYTNRDERKSARQAAILEAVTQAPVATQHEVVRALKKRGIEATQVSISRDIAELGLIKAGGVYRPAPAAGAPADPEAPLRSSVLRAQAAGANLVVIRCEAGMAPRVGLVLDGMTFPGIIGTLAGDDTVFIAVDSSAANKRLVDFLQSRIPRS